ncbi:4948_t:CDS:2 [Dentiscutata erythropus]|uniref:DNA-directed RNA polymerase n=1 Tax=Dentiscutata erythropus TaxID=1348616 RepID=A0A9N9FTE5_9GLOM|nr:4948_t:CDS:2 [Dentiscutata erythropus]
MYSGIIGEEFQVDIYIGVVYYRRLHHMVSDKWQVRSTGPIHNLTMQPIEGHKRNKQGREVAIKDTHFLDKSKNRVKQALHNNKLLKGMRTVLDECGFNNRML